MLKSELPHEAPNPVSKKTARVHHAARRRCGRLAGRGKGAASGHMSVKRLLPDSIRASRSRKALRRLFLGRQPARMRDSKFGRRKMKWFFLLALGLFVASSTMPN
jgi:hypothetical protein